MDNETRIADISNGRMRLRITGNDRVTFLNGQCTNDIKQLRPGQDCYAAFLNVKGKMRGEGHIICLPDAFMLEVSAGLADTLERFIITEDVAIEDLSATMGEWLVVNHLTSHDNSAPAGVSEPTIPAAAMTFAHPLGLGILSTTPVPVTLDTQTLDALRIEAGIPVWGVDMDENTIPIEAGLANRAISYDKGCYIGQETIARIKTYGHVNRQLVQLSVAGELLPVKGAKIQSDDKDVGFVTSAARSNRLGKLLALGYVRREFAVTGVELKIGKQSAEVLKVCGL